MTDVVILVRDINGIRRCLNLYSYEVVTALSTGIISEDEEILFVGWLGMCLYSSLDAAEPLTIDDLTGFFG